MILDTVNIDFWTYIFLLIYFTFIFFFTYSTAVLGGCMWGCCVCVFVSIFAFYSRQFIK